MVAQKNTTTNPGFSVRLGGELGQIGDLVHRLMQLIEKRQPVVAQLFIFNVDHHIFEKIVDGHLERGQRFQ